MNKDLLAITVEEFYTYFNSKRLRAGGNQKAKSNQSYGPK